MFSDHFKFTAASIKSKQTPKNALAQATLSMQIMLLIDDCKICLQNGLRPQCQKENVLLKAQLDATNAFPFTGQQPSITAFSAVNAAIVLPMRLNLIWHDYTCYQQRFNIIYHSQPSKHRGIYLLLLHFTITFTFKLYKQ